MGNMEENNVYQYKINDGKATLYRVYGNNGHIVLPEQIDGYPLVSIGPYCFSRSQRIPGDAIYSGEIDNRFELCGPLVESVEISHSITFIDSHAFYNCKKLQHISLSASLKDIGGDIFVNATKLHDITIREKASCPTILRAILHQISWDIEIHFQDLSLFYPEYYEVYDEIGPAHLFGMNIQGEGFRLRQCIKEDVVNLEEFDSVFEKLCKDESAKTLIHFALVRFVQNPEFYKPYILEHQKDVERFENLNLCLIDSLLAHAALTKESLDVLIAQSRSASETTQLIAYKKKYFPVKKMSYSFEDF